jgi:hypothetical protein
MQRTGGAWQRSATLKAGESSVGAPTAVGTTAIAALLGNMPELDDASTKGKWSAAIVRQQS